MSKRFLPALLLLIASPAAFPWDGQGHDAIGELALKFRPDLREKLSQVLTHLSESEKLQALVKAGLNKNSKYPPSEKDDIAGWIANLHDRPAHASVFPDWIRDFSGSGPYGPDHYIDLPFEGHGGIDTAVGGNALKMLDTYTAELTTAEPGEKAWALGWVMHLVEDLHQPLHCITRRLPDGSGDDHGGNSIRLGRTNLHAVWDDLLDADVQHQPADYAAKSYAAYQAWPQDKKDEFAKQRADLNWGDWAIDGRETIQKFGYPSDPQNAGLTLDQYEEKARAIAEYRALLSGARLADLLEKQLG